VLPTCDGIFHIDHATAFNEKRAPAPFPDLKQGISHLPVYTKGLEAYFNDHFGYRNRLIQWQKFVQMQVFRTGGTREVLLGRDGWLFYSEKEIAARSSFGRALPFSPQELADFKTLLEWRQSWLARRGSDYLFVVVPDKESIYPEFLPSWARPLGSGTRLDQLIAYLNTNSSVTVVDLRGALRTAKSVAPTYYKTDTHWNELGAFVGCEEIVRALSNRVPGLRPLGLDCFDVSRAPTKGGDLADMLGVSAGDEKVILSPRSALPVMVESVVDPGFVRPKYFTSNTNATGVAVVFPDSFGAAMRPFLGLHFATVGYFWTDIEFDPKIVEQFKPRVVISEIVERHFNIMELPNRLRQMEQTE
jgi:hypothetical protein